MAFSVVLFDLDGVLVDSVEVWYKTFNKALESVGKESVSRDLFFNDIFGESTQEDISRFFPGFTEVELFELYGKFFWECIGDVKVFDGVKPVLDKLKTAGLKTALVTNSQRDIAEEILGNTGLAKYFDVVVAGDDVDSGKPDPAMINLALEKLGLDPSDALFVGDTVWDIEAGQAAGVYTVGLRVDGGSHRVEDLGKLHALLRLQP